MPSESAAATRWKPSASRVVDGRIVEPVRINTVAIFLPSRLTSLGAKALRVRGRIVHSVHIGESPVGDSNFGNSGRMFSLSPDYQLAHWASRIKAWQQWSDVPSVHTTDSTIVESKEGSSERIARSVRTGDSNVLESKDASVHAAPIGATGDTGTDRPRVEWPKLPAIPGSMGPVGMRAVQLLLVGMRACRGLHRPCRWCRP